MIKEQQTTLAVSSYLKSEVLHLQLRKSKLDLQGFLHRQRNRKTGKRIPLRIHPTYSPVSLQWWVIRAEGLVHVPQPSCAMSFPRHIALTSKNTGVSHSSPVFDSCVAHMLEQVVLLGRNVSPSKLIHVGLLQHERRALSCADSPGRAESVQQLSVMSDYLF